MFSSDGFVDRFLEELDKLPDTPPDDGGTGKKRRTLEDSLLGEMLDTLLGDDAEVLDGRETEDTAEEKHDTE